MNSPRILGINKLKEVFLIGILDFNMKNCLSDHFLQSISLVNTSTGEVFHNGLGFKFLELPKFVKKEDELETELDKWVYMLKHMHSLDQIPKYLDKRVFEKIFNIAEMGRLSPEQQFVYDSILQREEDDYCRLKSAERRGIEKGKEEGLGQGEEKGKHETALAIARKMKEENFDLVKIARFTALSIEEIESL
ncbi:putative transposase/invertase (TIGR01784 family) [Pedobacter cryoconitis]|uniref:Putative transposase/invertase (TIGR01784 family) n=1 Tax=Pedobacter cryoconitis TaxID=188932 RepID=A0A7W8YXC8_9SPHI|nr:Rpn family recombination-promoting nuclease/putative transposase [Pedobacter cryoconitis]MBB5623510.1 putative transposase/invertase (TIGR01784 family) [Pedobacter cryoconitis]